MLIFLYTVFGAVFLLLVSLFDTVAVMARDTFVFTELDNLFALEKRLRLRLDELEKALQARGVQNASLLLKKAESFLKEQEQAQDLPLWYGLLFLMCVIVWPVGLVLYARAALKGQTLWRLFIDYFGKKLKQQQRDIERLDQELATRQRNDTLSAV